MRRNRLRRGDELNIRDEGKKLLIEVNRLSFKESIRQDVSGLNSFLVKEFLAKIYEKGYDNVFLIHNNIRLLNEIQKKTLELIGYETIEQNGTSCLIQSIASTIELNFDNSLRKIFLIVKQMLEACHAAYKDSDTSSLRSLYVKDVEVNRFCFFCLRHLNKERHAVENSHSLYYLINLLEELGNACKNLSSNLANSKSRNDGISGLIGLLLNQFDTAYYYFYKPTEEMANKSHAAFMDLDKKIKDTLGANLSADEITAIYAVWHASKILFNITAMKLDSFKEGHRQIHKVFKNENDASSRMGWEVSKEY